MKNVLISAIVLFAAAFAHGQAADKGEDYECTSASGEFSPEVIATIETSATGRIFLKIMEEGVDLQPIPVSPISESASNKGYYNEAGERLISVYTDIAEENPFTGDINYYSEKFGKTINQDLNCEKL